MGFFVGVGEIVTAQQPGEASLRPNPRSEESPVLLRSFIETPFASSSTRSVQSTNSILEHTYLVP